MLLEQVTANVPTLAEIDDKDDDGTTMRCKVRAAFGEAAVSVGSIDKADAETDAVDALANVLHYLDEISSFPDRLLARAVEHYNAERGAEPEEDDHAAAEARLRNAELDREEADWLDQLDGFELNVLAGRVIGEDKISPVLLAGMLREAGIEQDE